MEEQIPDLKQTLGVLWRRKVLIGAAIALTTAASVTTSVRQPKTYEATARMVVRPIVPGIVSGTGNGSPSSDLKVDSQAHIVESAIVGERVKTALKRPEDAESLAAAVSVSVVTDDVLDVRATAASPQTAADLANAFARQYLAYRHDAALGEYKDVAGTLKQRIDEMGAQIDQVDQQIRAAFQQLAAIPTDAANAGARAQAQASIDRLSARRTDLFQRQAAVRSRYDTAVTSDEVASSGGEVVAPAMAPAGAASPKPARDGIVGFILGLIVGLGLAFLREHFDDRIRTHSDAARAAGVPVLASVSRARAWRKGTHLAMLADPGSDTAESYRVLRQQLVAMGLGRGLRALLVTSGGSGAGKTATASNLGVAFAQSGMRVVLVSADLRKPRAHQFFGVTAERGLSDVLESGSSALDALVETGVPGLWLLPAGSATDHAAALLDRRTVEGVFAELTASVDVVIVDSPPLSSGADAAVLAPHADVTLLVLRRGQARAGGTGRAVTELRRAGAHRITAVLNMSDERPGAAYGYGYGDEDAALDSYAPVNGNGHAHIENGHALVTAEVAAAERTRTHRARTTRKKTTKSE